MIDRYSLAPFLAESPASATDGVRVLSLSESKLRKMVKSEPANAAQLLLNISKMLCLRLLTDR